MTQPDPIPEGQLLAYFDGALSADEAARVEARLEHDAHARATLTEWQRQNATLGALYAPVGEEPVPERLRAVIRDADAPVRVSPIRIAAMLALLAVGAAGGWTSARLSAPGPAPAHLAERAITAHGTFVVEVAHPVEVEAENAAHLIGWVSKRLGHDIAPPDFAAEGFRLMGGRILPGAGGPAALFMYENDLGRRVTLYVTAPTGNAESAFQFTETGGFETFYWMDGSLNYAVVGDIPREALRRIANLAYDQLI